jgi:precorrin isomerase
MYAFHRISKPEIEGRMTLILIEPKISRVLLKMGIDISEILLSEKDDFLKQLVKTFTDFDHRDVLESSQDLSQDFLDSLETGREQAIDFECLEPGPFPV